MFNGIFDAIEEWMRSLLTGVINNNLSTMFTDVNEKTGEIAAQNSTGVEQQYFQYDSESFRIRDFTDCRYYHHACALL